MIKTVLERIQDWYKNNCDGDWEHDYRIKIENIDNPGWSVEISLEDTALENAQFKKQYNNGDEDWIFIEVKEKKFNGAGDPNKLNEKLKIFLDEILLNQVDPNYTYPIYVPVPNDDLLVWKEVSAKVITESIFEITEVEETSFQNLQIVDVNDFSKLKLESLGELDYKIGDRVRCELKVLYDGARPVVVEKVKNNKP